MRNELKYVKMLEGAGLDCGQAELHLKVIEGAMVGNVVSRLDLLEVESRLTSEVGALKIDFANLKADFKVLKSEFAALRVEFEALRVEFAALRVEFEALRTDFKALEHKLVFVVISTISLVAGLFTGLAALLKYLWF